MLTGFTIVFLIIGLVLFLTVQVVPMRQSMVVERLGKFRDVLRPGLHFLMPILDRVAYVHEIREQVIDIPSQSCISKDNIQIEVDGLVYLKVLDPKMASYGIENYILASINLAQTTMRSEVGKLTLSETFSERENLNDKIVKEIDVASSSWGIKVLRYEVMNIQPSRHVVTTLEKQMEAEREKRAEITRAQAQKQAKINLSQGDRQEAINISEGEKQKRINESLGKAKQITLIAEATAQGIQIVAKSISMPGGRTALKLKLVEQFVGELGKIFDKADISVLPNEMANIKGVFEGFGQIADPIKK